MTDDGSERAADAVARDSATSRDDVTRDDTVPDDAYSGLFGAFPYALRSSQSLLFKSYALVAGLLALAVALLFGLSVVVLLGATATAAGGSFTFSRAFFVFVGFLVVAPLVAPVLFVARRHRRGTSPGRYDRTLAALGYLFVVSLYVALVISTPGEQQALVTGLFAPLVQFLYDLPRLAGLVPPLFVSVLIWLAGRRTE